MKFDDFDRQMRVYEESLDQFIAPEMYIAARLDGRSFTRLTKELCGFEAPFDVRFRDMMIGTVPMIRHLLLWRMKKFYFWVMPQAVCSRLGRKILHSAVSWLIR